MASPTTAGSGLQLQELDQHPAQRGFGRRKAKGGSDSKKNKQPRRGMGVAKLERLRLQDMTEGLLPLPYSDVNASSYYAQMRPTVETYGLTGSNRRLLQNHDDSDFLGKSGDLMSRSLVKRYALHCNACHKNKKVNNGRRILGLEFGDKQHFMNHDFGNYGNKVEVVGGERKGSSSGWEGGNGVLREYEFFPAAAKSEEAAGMMKQQVGFPGSSSSSCVDLSLKLSSY